MMNNLKYHGWFLPFNLDYEQSRQEQEKMYREEREMHKVTCAECGKETEVPFKPDGTRPVYCRDCYQKRNPRRNNSRRF